MDFCFSLFVQVHFTTNHHKIRATDLYKSYTMRQLLDKLDVLACYEDEKHALRIGEMLNKQAEIYEALGIELPTSSC